MGLGGFYYYLDLVFYHLEIPFFLRPQEIIWSTGEMLGIYLMAGFIANRANDKGGKYMGMFTFTFAYPWLLDLLLEPGYDFYNPVVLWYGIGLAGVLIWLVFYYIGY